MAAEYDLFLDESGTFTETSTDAAERGQYPKTAIPSQLAGLLVPHGSLTRLAAETVLRRLAEMCGLQMSGAMPSLHATEIRDAQSYDAAVLHLANQCRHNKWQPVRLVNAERVTFGDRVATYTSMLAELVVRICRQKMLEEEPRLRIHIMTARVLLKDTDEELLFIESPDYERQLRVQLAFANIRQGLAKESTNWEIAGFSIGSGRERADLQLCDWVSNASYANFRRCSKGVAEDLKIVFGSYDQTLYIREPLELAQRYETQGAHGLALLTLAELAVSKRGASVHGPAVQRLADNVCESLALQGHRARDPQLQVLVDWLEQIIDQNRSLGLGLQAAAWLTTSVYEPLKRRIGGQNAPILDWFAYAIGFWGLTVCNHLGDLQSARKQAATLSTLGARLVGAAEHSSLLARGMIALAVHYTDCFEHKKAAQMMEKLGATFENIMALLMGELGGTVDVVRSEITAMALGTALQAELYAGLGDRSRFDRARALSDKAIAEFADEADQRRQMQYRSQLETFAGNLDAARTFLASSLCSDGDSHESIGRAIKEMAVRTPGSEAFPLFHWMRLGVAEKGRKPDSQFEVFIKAFKESGFENTDWCRGQRAYYPAHGIVRMLCRLKLFANDHESVNRGLQSLNRLVSQPKNVPLVLELVHLAALCEVAAGVTSDKTLVEQLFASDSKDNPGITKVLSRIEKHVGGEFPAITELLGHVHKALALKQQQGVSDAVRIELKGFARLVGY
jgi:hypothetical protein